MVNCIFCLSNASFRSMKMLWQDQWDGSEGKDVCSQAWLEFDPRSSHGGRRKLTPSSSSLTFYDDISIPQCFLNVGTFILQAEILV